jgi:DNA repair protein RadC
MGVGISTDRNRFTSGSGSGNTGRSYRVSLDEVRADTFGRSITRNGLPKIDAHGEQARQRVLLAQLVQLVEPDHAFEIADNLLLEFGSLSEVLSDERLPKLRVFCGVAIADAISFAKSAVMEGLKQEVRRVRFDPTDSRVMNYLIATMKGHLDERLHVFFLDSQSNFIVDEPVATGTWSQISLRLRPLLRRAIQLDSARLVLVHNHPSGDPRPSEFDIQFTKEIARVSSALGIQVCDHLIVAGTSVFSMRIAGLVP